MFRSVKNWLTALIGALVTLALAVAWVYVMPSLVGQLEHQRLNEQTKNADLVRNTVTPFITYDPIRQRTTSSRSSLSLAADNLRSRLDSRIVVLDGDLTATADTGGSGAFTFSGGIARESLQKGEVKSSVVPTADGRYAVTAVPIKTAGSGQPAVAVALIVDSLNDVTSTVSTIQARFFLALLFALTLSLFLGYFVSFFIARRLKRIEQSAEAIATGDLSTTVPDAYEDEIGQLADAFNTMAERLRNAFAQVENERDRVEVLLNDLSEGVIGLSTDGAVAIANPAAASLFGVEKLLGQNLETIMPIEVVETWRESHDHGTVETAVFVRDERTLETMTYPVGSSADFTSIVVVRDVSARARLERARRDLIANASHEFKTPLFSLAGSLELIDEGDLSPEEQRDFLQIMRQQVDRLSHLALSMLDLSRVEAGAFDLHAENTGLVQVASSVANEFQARTQEKAIKVVIEGDPRDTAWCDEQRLSQILRALIDNAVKYSPERSTIRIIAEADDEHARLSVLDEGQGMADEDLPHVFERFHRGRRERATTAGSGLGLSIARELTELLGGQISAETRPEGGARFTIALPRHARGQQAGGAQRPAGQLLDGGA